MQARYPDTNTMSPRREARRRASVYLRIAKGRMWTDQRVSRCPLSGQNGYRREGSRLPLLTRRERWRSAAICPKLRSKRTQDRWPNSVACDPKATMSSSQHQLPGPTLDRNEIPTGVGDRPGKAFKRRQIIEERLYSLRPRIDSRSRHHCLFRPLGNRCGAAR